MDNQKELELEITNYTDVFVGMLDIMGFSTLGKKNSHDDLLKLYGMFLSAIQQAQHITHYENSSNVKINFKFISDSILIWSENDSIEDFKYIVYSIKNILYVGASMGLPLRGNLTHGDIGVFNNKYELGGNSILINEHNVIVGKTLI
ncbi:MAG: hypothetical protein IPK08_06330 [Bacteroidetes bacterium]|nr:hypothetical protein [Bacteroidota bacterium]